MTCPFCTLPSERIIKENEHAVWIFDGFPISLGHSLIIPKRHIQLFFEMSHDERVAVMNLLDQAQSSLDESHKADGYNIGINDGPAAGQTVPHLHIHLIPRYKGDVSDPRGGIRWIIPSKADYWSERDS